MIGSIIGGALGLASSLYGGWKASQAMKGVKKNLEQRQRENQNWYDRRYNEDTTQRADAQRVLTETARRIRERNRAAKGAQAVAGGTEESVAATKAANAEAMAEAASRIAAAGENRKDEIEQQYQQTRAGLDNQLNNLEAQRAAALTKAAQGAASAAATMGSGIDEAIGLGKSVAGVPGVQGAPAVPNLGTGKDLYEEGWKKYW